MLSSEWMEGWIEGAKHIKFMASVTTAEKGIAARIIKTSILNDQSWVNETANPDGFYRGYHEAKLAAFGGSL